MRELNDTTFEAGVRAGVTLVDFWAPWCAPCRMQLPILEQVVAESGQRVRVVKVNVDEAGQTAAQFGVRSIPTLILFKDGKPVAQFVGVQSAAALQAAIDEYASMTEPA